MRRVPRYTMCFGVAVAVITLAGLAQAADAKQSRAKMVELNKQALLSYQAGDWTTAKALLEGALKESRLGGLEGNNMTARTYVHLGAVQWTGFHDEAAAMQSFASAKVIRPDIQLTPLLETPELKSVFDRAGGEPALDEAAAPVARAAPPAVRSAARPGRVTGGDEPDLPATMSSPLMCTIPAVVAPHRELTFRCALRPDLVAREVVIHYRIPGVEAYQALGMRRTAKGWHIVTLPGSTMTPGMLQVYFEARDDAGERVASNGQMDSPAIIAVRRGGVEREQEQEEDPMAHINAAIEAEQYEAGLHRRRAGAFWLGLGGGMGWGYAPAGNLEWQREIKVGAVRTATGRFHLLPEIGYMVTDNFAIAAQGRIELIGQRQASYVDPLTGERHSLAANLPGAPATMAPAAFIRAIGYTDLSSGGNLRLSFSGDLGGGYLRLPVRPVAAMKYDADSQTYVPDYDRTIAKTDTRPIGKILAGASVGLLWNLSRHFAFSLDGRALTGLPNWGVIVEGGLSAQLSFGGVKGPAAPADDGEDDEADDDEQPGWSDGD